jgi:hypothetical protein
MVNSEMMTWAHKAAWTRDEEEKLAIGDWGGTWFQGLDSFVKN